MSERYMITGSQLAMLQYGVEHGNTNGVKEILDRIKEKQFLFNKNSDTTVRIRGIFKVLGL